MILLLGMTTICLSQTGDNVCTRLVGHKVTYLTTKIISERKCSSPGVCKTVYSLKKVIKIRLQYSIQRYCCPGFQLEDDVCVAVTTVTSTIEPPSTTPGDVVGPIEGALEEGDVAGVLSDGALIGVVLAVLAVMAAALVAVMLGIRRNKSRDKEAIIQREVYRGQSINEPNIDPDMPTGGAFHNDLYYLENKAAKEESFQPDMYDQLHLYGNEADEASHDYESPVRAHTVGGAPTALYSKAKQTYPSTKSEGHLAAMFRTKATFRKKCECSNGWRPKSRPPGRGWCTQTCVIDQSSISVWMPSFLVSRRDVMINCTFQKTTEYCQ